MAGRLAMMARPLGGKRLTEDIEALRAEGVGKVLSLLETDEAAELHLTNEAEICAANGIAFVSFPIPDRGLPADDAAFAATTKALADEIAKGETVVVHCRAGIGRSSLAAASILVLAGMPAAQALELLTKARGVTVPDTEAQRAWILRQRR
ncbi:MAG: dual specificity protein phosphatase family protein [Rhizomicrobium sp.]